MHSTLPALIERSRRVTAEIEQLIQRAAKLTSEAHQVRLMLDPHPALGHPASFSPKATPAGR